MTQKEKWETRRASHSTWNQKWLTPDGREPVNLITGNDWIQACVTDDGGGIIIGLCMLSCALNNKKEDMHMFLMIGMFLVVGSIPLY